MLELLLQYPIDPKPEAGFKPKDVRWAIVCGADGRFLDVVELGDTSQKRNLGRKFAKCPEFSFSEMKRGVTKSHFLVETAEVVALLGKNAETPEKIADKHEYFKHLLRKAGRDMPELERLSDSLAEPGTIESIRERLESLNCKPNAKVTFKVGESFCVESEACHDWWRDFRKTLDLETAMKKPGRRKERSKMRCLLTGDLKEPEKVHPKIEGLIDVGGLSFGDVLIGFKQPSFCSYGLKQSTNAAVSQEAATTYRAALNHLIRENGHRLSGTKVAYWFKEKVPREDDPCDFLIEGDREEQELGAVQRARELLDSLKTGERKDLAGNHFYALTLSGAGGRVMVRDWMEGQFEDLVQNIYSWFEDLVIVQRDGRGLARAPKFMAVLGAMVRDLKDLQSPLVSKFWRVAVRGEPFPQAALAQALARTQVDMLKDEPFNHARMGLMKAYHIRKRRNTGGERMPQDLKPFLNEEHPNPAYQCGRLMATLAALQRSALGDVGAGVVQRYYAAASVTPSLVFGRLVRTSQFHLGKLKPGLAYWYEGILGKIWGRIKNSLPRTLDLEEQSLFALGYYQQMAHLRTKKSDNSDTVKEQDHE